MMKYLYFALLTVVVSSSHAIAQRNFKPGYIVSLTGDTIKGLVDYKEWNQNPRDVLFKTTEQSASQRYSTAQITAFGVDQTDHYKRYVGTITTGAVDLAELSSGIDLSYVTDTIFLHAIGGGKNVTLYDNPSVIKTRFFITDGLSLPAELKRYVYLDNRQADKIREFNFYTQQLLALAIKYAPGNSALSARIDKVPYRAEDLKAIVLALNNNTDLYKDNNSGSSSEFFIGVGLNVLNASFSGTERIGYIENIFTAGNKEQNFGPLIAAGINIYFNKNVKKLLFKGEINFTMNEISSTYNGSYSDWNTKIDREERLTFNLLTFSAAPQLVYNVYNTDNFRFFVAAGIQLNFSSINNTHYYGTNKVNGVLENTTDKQLLYRKMTTNITGKTGVTIANKFDFYLGYGLPVMVTSYPSFGVNLSYYRIGLNYLLGN